MFWSSNFILPKKVIKALEQSFNHCVRKGQEACRGGIKVAWDQVCLANWNSAAVLKHIYDISLPIRVLFGWPGPMSAFSKANASGLSNFLRTAYETGKLY